MRVSVDRQPGFTFDVLLGEVDVVVFASVDDFHIDSLGGEVKGLLSNGRGCDDHERIGKRVVPDAFCVWVCCCGEVELDC